VTLVLVVRHGQTAETGRVLTGRTPGVPLDEVGREQARAVAARLAAVPLDAIVTSPVQRCRETAAAIAAARDGHPAALHEEPGLAEVGYGDWTGRPLKDLVKEPLFATVQAHPSAARFPGPDGESMPGMQRRAVDAVRAWNERLGPAATYLVCSHSDLIAAVLADALGMHFDMFHRIGVDPCSLSVVRYTPLRPAVLRMNDTGSDVARLVAAESEAAHKAASESTGAATGQDAGE
jgi:probable phosphoglycerate mutase